MLETRLNRTSRLDSSSFATALAIAASAGGGIYRSADGGTSFRALEKQEPSMRDLMKGSLASAELRSLAQA